MPQGIYLSPNATEASPEWDPAITPFAKRRRQRGAVGDSSLLARLNSAVAVACIVESGKRNVASGARPLWTRGGANNEPDR